LRIPRAAVLLPCLFIPLSVYAQSTPDRTPSLDESVQNIRRGLHSIRASLDGGAKDRFEPADVERLQSQINETERELEAFAQQLEKSRAHPGKQTRPLVAAAGAVVADDAVGVGIADDFLLPILGVTIVFNYVRAELQADAALIRAQERLNASIAAMLQLVVAMAKKKNDGKCYCQCARLGARGAPQGRMTQNECKQLCEDIGYPVHICK